MAMEYPQIPLENTIKRLQKLIYQLQDEKQSISIQKELQNIKDEFNTS